MKRSTRPAILRIALAVVVVAGLATLTGTSPVTTAPAEARVPSKWAVAAAQVGTGIVTVKKSSARDARSPKLVVAQCPPGKQVLGGAGAVDGSRDHGSTVVLTERMPTSEDSVYGYGYAVTAAETPPGGGDDQRWAVHAWAFCADPMPGHHIVNKTTGLSSPPMREAVATCPAGQRVLGTGAKITPVFVGVGYRNIGLQMVRAFQPDTDDVQAVRVQASELPIGYDHNWRLTASAVCADAPLGYTLEGMVSGLHGSENLKTAAVGCPPFLDWVNVGAAVDTFTPGWGAPGNITLLATGWNLDNGTVTAHAWENTPTSVNWVLEVQTICIF